jgi:hypothetical protein
MHQQQQAQQQLVNLAVQYSVAIYQFKTQLQLVALHGIRTSTNVSNNTGWIFTILPVVLLAI